jgi:hypothetical protein
MLRLLSEDVNAIIIVGSVVFAEADILYIKRIRFSLMGFCFPTLELVRIDAALAMVAEKIFDNLVKIVIRGFQGRIEPFDKTVKVFKAVKVVTFEPVHGGSPFFVWFSILV